MCSSFCQVATCFLIILFVFSHFIPMLLHKRHSSSSHRLILQPAEKVSEEFSITPRLLNCKSCRRPNVQDNVAFSSLNFFLPSLKKLSGLIPSFLTFWFSTAIWGGPRFRCHPSSSECTFPHCTACPLISSNLLTPKPFNSALHKAPLSTAPHWYA